MRRWPKILPGPPAMGVRTAPASSVAVSIQEASAVVVFSNVRSCTVSGTTRVCISETTMLEKAKEGTAARGDGYLCVSTEGPCVMRLLGMVIFENTYCIIQLDCIIHTPCSLQLATRLAMTMDRDKGRP